MLRGLHPGASLPGGTRTAVAGRQRQKTLVDTVPVPKYSQLLYTPCGRLLRSHIDTATIYRTCYPPPPPPLPAKTRSLYRRVCVRCANLYGFETEKQPTSTGKREWIPVAPVALLISSARHPIAPAVLRAEVSVHWVVRTPLCPSLSRAALG